MESENTSIAGKEGCFLTILPCIFSFLPIANEKKSLFAWETAVPYAKKKVFLSSAYEWREAVSFSLPVYTLLASTFM